VVVDVKEWRTDARKLAIEKAQLEKDERMRIFRESSGRVHGDALDAAVQEALLAPGERCSHCCQRMHVLGGVKNGRGEYCKACAEGHIVRGAWFEKPNCRHCMVAGVLFDSIYCC